MQNNAMLPPTLREYYVEFINKLGAHPSPDDQSDFIRLKNFYAFLESFTEDIHWFCDMNGHVYDCIPINNQPGWHKSSGPLPAAPDLTKIDALKVNIKNRWRDAILPAPLADRQKKDKYGNLMACPDGTVPIRRIEVGNIDNLKQNTLTRLFRSPKYRQSEGDVSHHLVAMGQQQVDASGGHSIMNLWKPLVERAIKENRFSLSQVWYSAGFLGQENVADLQTIECGYIVSPGLYQDENAHLFIFYTPDGYKSGSWDLTGENTFVQTSQFVAPGMILSPSSVIGGQQYEFELTVLHHDSRWWIYYNREAMGFYPEKLFNDGQLTKNATYVTFGGESASNDNNFPPMGSGKYAAEGWQLAAYQRRIGYFPASNPAANQDSTEVLPEIMSTNLKPICGIVTTEDHSSEDDTLIDSIKFKEIDSPNCISIRINADVNRNGSEQSLWFGGPGGHEDSHE
jgi:hypothetical protein